MQLTETRRPSCCGDEECGRALFVRLLLPNEPLENDVESMAVDIARNCAPLCGQQLEACFSHVFEITPECKMFNLFRAAYEAERSRAAIANGPRCVGTNALLNL